MGRIAPRLISMCDCKEMSNVIHFTDFAGEELHIMYVRSHEDMKLVNTLGTVVKQV